MQDTTEKSMSFNSWVSRNTVPEAAMPLCRGAHSAAWYDKRINNKELLTMCEVLMCSDPWPDYFPSRDVFEVLCDRFAREHGYSDWIEAYLNNK